MTLWEERDYPILQAIAALEAAAEYEVTVGSIGETVGREAYDTWIGLQSLRDADYIDWIQDLRMADGTQRVAGPRVPERGRIRLGQWPQDEYSALVAAIEHRIAATEDPGERSRLERLRDGLVAVGQGVVTDLLATVIKSQTGL